MAGKAEMERLVGMAAFDTDFRNYILADPDDAARALGIFLEPEQAEAIKNLDRETIDALGALFNKEALLQMTGPEGFWRARAQIERFDKRT